MPTDGGVSISPGHAAAGLVLASQEQEEKKTSFKKLFLKSLNNYSSVRNCFMEQFSSFAAFLKYCSSIIVTVSSSGGV